ncbi:AsnC family transcriptional regulator [beta proteobacterium AAP99]|nr:AsnC family transcriptional regulator [beta proteobacterium AAP99]
MIGTSETPAASDLDAIDRRILDLMQRDASLTNQALAERVGASPATTLRRVRRLREAGVIEREVALLAPRWANAGLTAVVEVSLQAQTEELLSQFEQRCAAEAAVQQCYRVSAGPDLVLVLHVPDMAGYQTLAAQLFSDRAAVRNVRTFFVTKRSKFEPRVAV